MITVGTANTPNASRYLQQVCKHWSHRFSADFDADRGHVDFGDGSSVTLGAGDGVLNIAIDCPAESVEMLKGITIEHIDRFAHKEGGLTYIWQTPSA